MECHGYNINPNHQCTMDHPSIIWAHFELQMILCMVKCQTHPQCSVKCKWCKSMRRMENSVVKVSLR